MIECGNLLSMFRLILLLAAVAPFLSVSTLEAEPIASHECSFREGHAPTGYGCFILYSPAVIHE